jgi:hypothetical protein
MGFLVLCLMVLVSRPLLPVPVRRAVPANSRRQIPADPSDSYSL